MAMIISEAGLKAMQDELEKLKEELNKLRVFKGSVAIHSGDAWHDNNDFEQCEIDERRLIRQIADLTAKIESAEIQNGNQNSTEVDFGAKVTIQLYRNGAALPQQTILFSDDPNAQTSFMKITPDSPLGGAIYKKSVGHTGTYSVQDNHFKVEILKIEY